MVSSCNVTCFIFCLIFMIIQMYHLHPVSDPAQQIGILNILRKRTLRQTW